MSLGRTSIMHVTTARKRIEVKSSYSHMHAIVPEVPQGNGSRFVMTRTQ
jgi:hypothetical protein